MEKQELHICNDCGKEGCKGRGLRQAIFGNEPFPCGSWQPKSSEQKEHKGHKQSDEIMCFEEGKKDGIDS